MAESDGTQSEASTAPPTGDSGDSSGKKGVASQLKKVAAPALVVALAPVVKKGVETAAEKAAEKGPELLSNAGGPMAIAEKARDALRGGGDAGGLLAKLPGLGGGDGGGDAGDGTGQGRRMPVQQAVDVAAPIEIVYNQFTQFEDFPKFMHRVERVDQRDETHVTFKTKQWGVNRQWEAEITDQRPDERIAWRSVSGVNLTGVATFHRLSDRLTRIEVNVDFDPNGLLEKIGRGMRFAKRSIRADLHRFKAYVEMREEETGDWRGFVSEAEVVEEEEYFEETGDEGEEPAAEEEPVAEGAEDEDIDEEEPVAEGAEDEDIDEEELLEPEAIEPEEEPSDAEVEGEVEDDADAEKPRSGRAPSGSRSKGSAQRRSGSGDNGRSRASGDGRSRSKASGGGRSRSKGAKGGSGRGRKSTAGSRGGS